MHVASFRLSLLLAALASSVLAAQAQTAPDAGNLLQQIERERTPPVPKRTAPVTVAPPALTTLPGPSVTVSSFHFEGATLLGTDRLAAVVAPFLNRPLTFSQLQEAQAAVANLYRRKGWIVRVYLPRQEIKDGVVTLQVIEAVFGRARLEGTPPTRVATDRLLGIVGAAQPEGVFVNADALDRALLLLGDTPGITAEGSLQAGAQSNETDLLLKLQDGPLVNGDVGADNTNSRSTGSARAFADLYLNSPLHLGDQVVANLIHSRGSDYARGEYTLPVGDRGLRVGASMSGLSYRLTAGDLAALDAKGTATTVGLQGSYPLVRSRLVNLNLLVNVDHRHFDNKANGAVVTRYDTDDLSAGIAANLLDGLAGGGSNNASLVLVQGRLRLGDSPNRDADAASTRTGGDFTKLRYAASRVQVLSEAVSVFAGVSGQAASKNLDSSEKFYLGGAYGVRAYPNSEGGGADGQLLTLEVRGRLPANVALTGFYDLGHVSINHDNDFAGAANPNSVTLKGCGASVGWVAPFGLSLKATWARRIGSNPDPTPAGRDQDGSLVKNRFWLQAVQPF